MFFSKKEYEYSMLRMEDFLPVGSVIKIKGEEGLYIILDYGGFEKVEKNKYKEIDYHCWKYPLGMSEFEEFYKTISFSDIEEVVFEGYNGENRKEMLRIIDEGGYRYG